MKGNELTKENAKQWKVSVRRIQNFSRLETVKSIREKHEI